MYIMFKYARDITLFRNMFLKNNYKLIKNNTKKTMIWVRWGTPWKILKKTLLGILTIVNTYENIFPGLILKYFRYLTFIL